MMKPSWADAVAEETAASGSSDSNVTTGPSALTKSTYVPPHLRNRPVATEPPASSFSGPPSGNNRIYGVHGISGIGQRSDYSSQGYSTSSRGGGGGWGNRGGRERDVNPFGNDNVNVDEEQAFSGHENSGINFDAYEDIPVETQGNDVPPPVNTFAEIDLGQALNLNIQRCKYVRPTPVQRYTIPISLAGRDLMACAQTGSGKTAAFCFPIISGIMRGNIAQRPRGTRTVFPLALILSPTRELAIQVST